MTISAQVGSNVPFRERKVIAGLARATVMTGTQAQGDTDLWNFPCGIGVHTQEGKRAVREVQGALSQVYEGTRFPTKVVKVTEDSGGLIGVAVVSMTGDHTRRALTRAPYVEAIGRHDDYYRYTLRDKETTAGAIVLRATVDAIALDYDEGAMPEIWARVLVNNTASHTMFDELGFDRLPKEAFNPPTEQVVRVRRSDRPRSADLDSDLYLPPEPPPPVLGRNDRCWCGSGVKFKKCHGF